MGKSCAALGCSNGIAGSKLEDANISFHKFPLRHPDLLNVWTTRTGRRKGGFAPTEHSRLCSRHFSRSDFINPDAPKARRLRDDSVPSLNLPGFPCGEGVGCSTVRCDIDEDPRIHATMVPPREQANHLDRCQSLASPRALPPSQLRKLAHKLESGDGPDSHMDPVLRETWDVLMSDGEFPAAQSTPIIDSESNSDEKVVRSKPQIWSHSHLQQQQQQQQQTAQQQLQQPSRLATSTPCEESAELLEEQEQQLEHTTSRAFQAVVTSPHVAEEAFPQTISNSSHDDYQPPTKKQFLAHSHHITCSMAHHLDAQGVAVSQASSASLVPFDCPPISTPLPHPHPQHPHPHPHLPLPFDFARHARSILQAAAAAQPPTAAAAAVPAAATVATMSPTQPRFNGHGGLKASHREKTTVACGGGGGGNGVWGELGRAVRCVAEGFAHFLRTKADIARERHQLDMERKRRRMASAAAAAAADAATTAAEAQAQAEATKSRRPRSNASCTSSKGWDTSSHRGAQRNGEAPTSPEATASNGVNGDANEESHE